MDAVRAFDAEGKRIEVEIEHAERVRERAIV
jgi:hypothetical protein